MSKPTVIPEKTTVLLSNLYNAWLDEVAAGIRRSTGADIACGGIVRAITASVGSARVCD